MIVTDRISAFDVVFDELIPNKGKVLNGISEFWFDFCKDIIGNHIVTTDVPNIQWVFPSIRMSFREDQCWLKEWIW